MSEQHLDYLPVWLSTSAADLLTKLPLVFYNSHHSGLFSFSNMI